MSVQYGEGLPPARRRLVVTTVALTTVLSVLDGTISNVALPTIGRALDASSDAVVWVVNAFQLVTAVLLVPLSTLGDIVGYARIYRIGVTIFVLGSALCAVSHTLPELVGARIVQAIGASGILASSQPISRFAFPAAQLGTAIAINSFIVSIANAAGPSVGGLILSVGPWPWLFLINLPLGIGALALSGMLPAMPRSQQRFDWYSAVLSGATILLLVTGLDQVRAPAHPLLFGLEIGAAIILARLAIVRQRQLDPPFLPIDLLGIRVIGLSLIASFVGFCAQSSGFVALPFYFHALGYDAAQVGLLMTPFPLGSALIAIVAGWLADRYHASLLGGIGLALYAAAMLALTLLSDHAAIWELVVCSGLAGVGFGVFILPNLRTMVHAAPPHRSGAITGLTVSARLIGTTTGVAVAAIVFSFGTGSTPGSVGFETLRLTLAVSAGFALLALIVSSLRIEELGELRRQGRVGPWT